MDARLKHGLTAFVLITMVFLSAIYAMQGALLDPIIAEYALESSQSGLPNAMAFAGSITALITALFMQGHVAKHTLMRAASAVCAVGLVLLRLAPNFAMFNCAWFLLGYGLGLMDPVLSACMADLYGEGKLATVMMCVLHTTFGLASMLTPILYRALIEGGMYWRDNYVWVAVFGLAAIAISLPLAKGASAVTRLRGEIVSPRALPEVLVKGHIALPMLAMFFHGIFLSGMNTWINRYSALIGGDAGLPAMTYMFCGIMLSRLIMSFVRIDPRRYVRVGGFAACAVLALGLAFEQPALLKASVLLSGLLFGALLPCVFSLACQRMQENSLMVTTAIMLAMYIGQAVSSPVIGALEGAVGLRWGIALCAACMALCSAVCLCDKRMRA